MNTVILWLVLLMIIAGSWLLRETIESLEVICSIVAVVSGICLFMALISWPIARLDYKSKIMQYEAVKMTVASARVNKGETYENAALTAKISEVNEQLAIAKYWDMAVFDLYIPDAYINLPYLK